MSVATTGVDLIAAAFTMSKYEMPVTSDMMKAPAPMTGGMICPPVPAMASMAAAVFAV